MDMTQKKKSFGWVIVVLIGLALAAAAALYLLVLRPAQERKAFIAAYGQEAYDTFGVVKTGETVLFGAYEQDGDLSNGAEPLEWNVLTVQDGRALLLSRYGLDCKPYYDEYTDVTWEESTVRAWLNDEFLHTAALNAEKIAVTTVTDVENQYHTVVGNPTQDRIFLLSRTELEQYLPAEKAQVCEGTAYCFAQGAYKKNGVCWWWLRSPGINENDALYVYLSGGVNGSGIRVDTKNMAVRPAMWVELK